MDKKKVFIIAEAGVNHNGELGKAFKLVDIAYKAGVDAIKFQTFKPGECTGKFATKVDYIRKSSTKDETRYNITQKLALAFEDFKKIQKYTLKKGLLFLTTPDGIESLDYITNTLQVPIIKVSSTEVTNLEFLEKIAMKKIPVIFSTGLSTLGEVETALNIMNKHNNDITLLHCTSEYPVKIEEVNLKAMVTLKSAFNCKVGLSDHTLGFEAAIAAVALGASVIEKHFTIDKNMQGPDHKASLSPEELKEYVVRIRNTELLLGSGKKEPSKSEMKNISGIRRSVVAAKFLEKGTIIKKSDITLKRPGTGIHPYDVSKIIGFKLNRSLDEDEPVKWEYFK